MAAQQAIWIWLPCNDIVRQWMLLMMDEDAAPCSPILFGFILQTCDQLLVIAEWACHGMSMSAVSTWSIPDVHGPLTCFWRW